MTNFVALDDVLATQEQLGTPGSEIWRTHFLKPAAGTRLPQAFLVAYAPGRVLRTHFHDVDEFQIVVAGHGTFGSHAIAPFTVHFARAFTPYGPIVAGAQGLSFLTLRARRDSAGPRLLPEQRELLESTPHRSPWQASAAVDLSADDGAVGFTLLRPLFDPHGLAACVLTIPPRIGVRLPPAHGSGGQYAVVVRGSVHADAREFRAPALAFVAAENAPMHVTGGADGAAVIVLDFPEHRPAVAASAQRATVADPAIWRCSLCGFEYREAEGQPALGIPAGTRWSELASDWHCSDCQAPKADFAPGAA